MACNDYKMYIQPPN